MATAGLSFANPFMEKVNVGEEPNPYAPFSPTSSIGMGGLAPSAADMALLGERLTAESQFTLPEMQKPPSIAFSPSKNQLFVQGTTFSADDAAAALQAESLLGGPGTGLPTTGDWVPLDQAAYSQFTQSIKEPGLWRLANKNFGRGIDVLQLLSGYGLQYFGAEETGAAVVAAQERDLAKTAPFERQFTGIESGDDAVEWLVANFAQQGPMLIESILVAGLGFLAGTATGGPIAGVGGALAALMGKSAFKQSVMATLKKKAAGEALSKAEDKLLREAAGIAGAVTASYGSNVLTGISDIYGELREQGADPSDVDARIKAALGSLPYAALETLPEFLLASRVFGGAMAPRAIPPTTVTTRAVPGGTQTITRGATRLRRGAEYARRGAVGFGVGGLAEGTTEAGQEALLLGISGQDLSSPEAVERLINSFAAGFGVGGPLGGVANLRSKKPQNMLDPGKTPEPAGYLPYGSEGELVGPAAEAGPPQLPAPAAPTALPAPPMAGAAVAGAAPNFIIGPDGVARPATTMDVPITVTAPEIMGQVPGQQGVLNVFGGQPMLAGELAGYTQPRVMAPTVEPAPQEVTAAAVPQQMGLPLDTTIPDIYQQAAGQPLNAMQQALVNAANVRAQREAQARVEADAARLRQERQRQFDEAQNERLRMRYEEAQRQLLERQQREFEEGQRQPGAPAAVSLPYVPYTPPTPQQLELLRRATLPKLTKGQRKLQRGQRNLVRAQQAAQEQEQLQALMDQYALAYSQALDSDNKPLQKALDKEAKNIFGGREWGQVKGAVTKAKKAQAQALRAEARGEITPVQPDLFAQQGVRDYAARAQEFQEAAAGERLRKGGKGAVQERSTEEMDAGEQAGDGEKVGGRDTKDRRPAGAGKAKVAKGKGGERKEKDVRKTGEEKETPRETREEKVVVPTGFASPAEAWDEMVDVTPAGAPVVAYENLPDAAKAEWGAEWAAGNATGFEIDRILSKYEDDLAAVDRIHQAIAVAESTSDLAEFDSAINTIVDLAYVDTNTNLDKKTKYGYTVRELAVGFLDNTQFTGAQQELLDAAVVEQINFRGRVEGAYKSGPRKGETKPWLKFVSRRNLLDAIKAQITNPPQWYQDAQAAVKGEVIGDTTQKKVKETLTTADQKRLSSEGIEAGIRRLLTGIDIIRNKANSKFVTTLEELFQTADPNYIMADKGKVGEYFDKDGKLRLRKRIDGSFIPVNREFTAEELKQIEADERAAAEARKESERLDREQEAAAVRRLESGESTLYDETILDDIEYDDEQQDILDSFGNTDAEGGAFFRDDGTTIDTTVSLGRVRLIAAQFLRRLKVKPKLTVVRNISELASKHPEIYDRAVKSFKNFEAMAGRAVGFSVGDQVIIFADRVRTEKQLRFVLAHEAVGHFGLKAILSPQQLKAVLTEIYENDPFVRARVDRMVDTEGMSRLEATEEVLADMAGAIDASMIAKIWNAIKNFLNSIGLRFDDDVARYWVNQARRNVKRGHGVVSAEVLARNLDRLAKATTNGRFSLEQDSARIASTAFASNAFNNKSFGVRGFKAFIERIKGIQGQTIKGGIDEIVSALAETVQTLDNMASRSEGLQYVFNIFQKQAARTRRFLSKYEGLTTFSHMPAWKGGPTAEELQQAGEMLAYAALLKRGTLTDKMMKDIGDLYVIDEYGNPQRNEAAIQRMMAAGKVTREQFNTGFTVTNSLGQEIFYKPRFEITDNIWKVFEEQRNAVNQSALDVLESNFYAANDRKKEAVEGFKNFTGKGGSFTSADIDALARILKEYGDLYTENSVDQGGSIQMNMESMKKANRFLKAINRALHEGKKVDDWKAGVEDTAEFQGERYQDIIDSLERLNAVGLSKDRAYDVTNTIANLFMLDSQIQSAQFYAKRTVMGAYVPFVRRGKYQVIMKAYDKDGKAVKLNAAYQSSMPYFQDDSRSGADELVAELDSAFGGDKTFTVLNVDNEEVQVTFRAERSRTLETAQISNSVDFNEFINTLNRLKIGITPEERHTIVQNLTNANARARKNLERSGSPGWDKDVLRATSEFLETQGHVAGKAFYRHRLNDVMVDRKMWRGNPEKLKRLKDAVENAKKMGNPEAVKVAQKEYDRYAYMYMYMADAGNGPNNRVTIGGRTYKTLGRGNVYLDQANRLLDWYSNSGNIVDSTEDLLSGEVGSKLKMWAVLMQLGGSVATAAINLVSLVTHSIPYLSTYNAKRGFGGGFGMAKSAANIYRATSDLKNRNLATVDYLNKVVESKELQAKHGLTQEEAEFLRDATAEGVLQAAQFNALVGTARGGVRSNNFAGAIQIWMSLFSYTEQLNRRATALAAYRMEKERGLASGMSEAEARDRAAQEAYKAVNTSQGEYAMYNRPEMARGNVLQYIFMYKQFVIISVQLMKAMATKERVIFLAMLVLMSGLKGIPFADDLMDLADTLAQKFGIKMGSVEKELATLVDELAPGMSPIVMRGLMDRYTGMTISTRLGFGDLIPLSGAFKAGADPVREMENFAGPVWSGIAGLAGLGTNLVRYGAEAIGLKEDTTSLVGILRNQPIAAIRNLTDGLTYLSDGSITNAQGKMVDPSVSTTVAIGRMLGFYPAQATLANDVVRMGKQANNYALALRNEFTAAYVKAAVQNDTQEMARVKELVREWNSDTRGTEFEFRTWFRSANRAAKEAKKPTALRYKKTTQRNLRKEVDDLMRIYGLEY